MSLTKAGNIFNELLFRLAGARYKDFVRLILVWENVVGSLLAQKAKIYKVDEKVVFVKVENNIWLQELILLKSEIKQKLKRQSGVKIKEIVFFIKNN
jgi:predicted nucleic acid-binding Zn ribbon protein